MASIRSLLLDEVVARLGTISGWDVQLRAAENHSEADVRALAYAFTEQSDYESSSPALYSEELLVKVSIIAAADKADPDLDRGPESQTPNPPNPYRFLDRLIVLAHKALHESETWETVGFEDFRVLSIDIELPSNSNEVEATMILSFKFRHAAKDPEAFP